MGIWLRAFLGGQACFSRVAASFFGVDSLAGRLRLLPCVTLQFFTLLAMTIEIQKQKESINRQSINVDGLKITHESFAAPPLHSEHVHPVGPPLPSRHSSQRSTLMAPVQFHGHQTWTENVQYLNLLLQPQLRSRNQVRRLFLNQAPGRLLYPVWLQTLLLPLNH